MAKAARVISILAVGVCFCSLPAFVPGPAHPARSMAPAAAGALSMLGAAPAFADKIDDAAKKLSDASYPFLKEIDWTADYAKNIPGADPLQMAKAISKTIDMGAAMDPSALKAGVLAHSKAIGSIDANGLTSKADYEAINAAIGHMVSSAGEAKTLDVYNAWAGVVAAAVASGQGIPAYLIGTVNPADAQAAYNAFLEFKDVVKSTMK